MPVSPLEAALYRSQMDAKDDLSSDDGKSVAPKSQTDNKANCVTSPQTIKFDLMIKRVKFA